MLTLSLPKVDPTWPITPGSSRLRRYRIVPSPIREFSLSPSAPKTSLHSAIQLSENEQPRGRLLAESIRLLTENFKPNNSLLWRQLTAPGFIPRHPFLVPKMSPVRLFVWPCGRARPFFYGLHCH